MQGSCKDYAYKDAGQQDLAEGKEALFPFVYTAMRSGDSHLSWCPRVTSSIGLEVSNVI